MANPFKKTGIIKLVIGEPCSPDSGNWIHVAVTIHLQDRLSPHTTRWTETVHRFKVQDYDEILPEALDISRRLQTAMRDKADA